MNQEWYCTSKAIAHNMIVFITSTCDKLKTQVFHQSSSESIILHNNMPVSALDKVVTLQVKFCLKGIHRLQSSRRRLLATEMTCAHQANLKNVKH